MATPYEIGACPACHGSDADEIASADELQAEVEALWEFHTKRLRPDTPHQQLIDRVVFSQRTPLRIARCGSCGTLYRNPREPQHTAEQIYADEDLPVDVMDRLFEAQRAAYRVQAERLTRMAGTAGRGLEVGSYVGGYLAAAQEHGWRVRGIDVNEGAVRYAHSRGLEAAVGTIESLETGGERYDAIAIWNCLDQLAQPRATVASAYRLLRAGGLLAVRVPNGAFYARMRGWLNGPRAPLARTVLAANNLLGFPYRTGFTPDSLHRMLHAEGFAVLATRGDALVDLADEWTRGWAAAEERVLKRVLRALPGSRNAPWFEVYARR